jgi:serine/threonine-protein kinase
MSDELRVQQLLDEILDSERTPEEVCGACPELLPEARQTEAMVLPNLPEFLQGKYQPQDNDERMALLGVCQFKNLRRTAARLYADAFAANPKLAEDMKAETRYRAARCAALAGCGGGADGASLSPEERARCRRQARDWLQADLGIWAQTLDSGSPADRVRVRKMMTRWQADRDLAALPEPAALEKWSADERKQCLALWREVTAVLQRASTTK